MLLTFTIFAYSTKAEIFEYEISCFWIETLFILIISLQVNIQVLVLPFIQYSFPIAVTNNTVPLVRNWTGWIHRNSCLNELQEGRNWKVPIGVGLTPPPVRLAPALPAWALKPPEMESAAPPDNVFLICITLLGNSFLNVQFETFSPQFVPCCIIWHDRQ